MKTIRIQSTRMEEHLIPGNLLLVSKTPSAQSLSNRLFDLLSATVALAVFSPVFFAAPLLIFLEDRGPIFFRQKRCGWKRKPFTILKFRTMRDEKVTRVGGWLRTTGLDETAQFLAVFRGKMSVVGPRPLTQNDITRLGWHSPRFDARWQVKPGITGLAQVFGGRSARHSWQLDRLYLRRKSLGLDLRLVALSFAMNLFGKNRTRAALRTIRRCL